MNITVFKSAWHLPSYTRNKSNQAWFFQQGNALTVLVSRLSNAEKWESFIIITPS